MKDKPKASRDSKPVCNHCQATYPPMKEIPLVDDERAWAEIAKHHKPDCRWVRSRAGRIKV